MGCQLRHQRRVPALLLSGKEQKQQWRRRLKQTAPAAVCAAHASLAVGYNGLLGRAAACGVGAARINVREITISGGCGLQHATPTQTRRSALVRNECVRAAYPDSGPAGVQRSLNRVGYYACATGRRHWAVHALVTTTADSEDGKSKQLNRDMHMLEGTRCLLQTVWPRQTCHRACMQLP